MALVRWDPKAGAVQQEDTITIANVWAQGDTITVTINTKTLVVTIGTLVTTDEVATTLNQALNGEAFTDTAASVSPAGGGPDVPELSQFEATVAASVVTLKVSEAGVPVPLTSVTESTAGTGTATLAAVNAANGRNFVDNANNYDPVGLPAASDDLIFENSDVGALYGTFPAVLLDSLSIHMSYTGDIGLPKNNPAGYAEFLPDYQNIAATVTEIGLGEGNGSGRIKLNYLANTVAAVVVNSGAGAEFGVPAVLLKGTSSSNTLSVQNGSVGFAFFGDDIASIAESTIAGGSLEIGKDVTSGTTLLVAGGTCTLRSDFATSISQSDGTLIVDDPVAPGNLNIVGGTCFYRSIGTITTLSIGGSNLGGTVDLSQDTRQRAITNPVTVGLNANFIDPGASVSPKPQFEPADGVAQIAVT